MKISHRIMVSIIIFANLFVLFHVRHACAHKLAPSLLQITEIDQSMIDVFWKESTFQKKGDRVDPVLPVFCSPVGNPSVEKHDTGISLRWQMDCNGKSLKGSRIRMNWTGRSSTCVVLRIVFLNGQLIQTILTPKNPMFMVPPDQSTVQVMKNYLVLGVKHLLSGFDHMLFITGLLFMIRRRNLLLWTITAFTAGHSITLSLAALGFINFPTEWIELGIAISIFILAVEVASIKNSESENSWLARRPWAMAIGFGLLHGLGFASALGEIGLPKADIPAALLSFNVGIEIGQCAWVFLIWLLGTAYGRLSLPSFPQLRLGAIYAMGTCATYWCIERFIETIL